MSAVRQRLSEACTHCDRLIDGNVHIEGRQRGLQRCDSADSGLPYGYNAHSAGTPCANPCRGAYEPEEVHRG